MKVVVEVEVELELELASHSPDCLHSRQAAQM